MSGLFGLIGKYARALREAWAGRKAMAPPRLQPHEVDFLPAHLEVRDRPISPAPMWVARLIVLFALLAIFTFFDLVGELESVGAGGYTLRAAFFSVGLSLPSRMVELMPIAALIGTIFIGMVIPIFSLQDHIK